MHYEARKSKGFANNQSAEEIPDEMADYIKDALGYLETSLTDHMHQRVILTQARRHQNKLKIGG